MNNSTVYSWFICLGTIYRPLDFPEKNNQFTRCFFEIYESEAYFPFHIMGECFPQIGESPDFSPSVAFAKLRDSHLPSPWLLLHRCRWHHPLVHLLPHQHQHSSTTRGWFKKGWVGWIWCGGLCSLGSKTLTFFEKLRGQSFRSLKILFVRSEWSNCLPKVWRLGLTLN